MTTRKFTGSCHCGKVRFEADIDLSKGTVRCNCTICAKARAWAAMIKPSAFRLLSGQDALADYQRESKMGHYLFCKHCGIRPFATNNVEALGGEYVSVNIACLDDVTPEELGQVPIEYLDGRNDSWWNRPAVSSYL
ncbi:GFA family protein [Hyalangium gracile]|uniref:GFA family protein n=1 Tax=Hyalangium gracile TaxID=394092 RepID=UPI001CD00B11|nr:GFA family protein [Hyalangium gracile]